MQQKFDDVETKLTERVQATIDAKVKQLGGDEQARDRLSKVEDQIQTLVQHQQKLENWATDNSSKVADLQTGQQQLSQAMHSCQHKIDAHGNALQTVAQEVTKCATTLSSQGHSLQKLTGDVAGLQRDLKSELEGYFSRQTATIEALIEKRAKHS